MDRTTGLSAAVACVMLGFAACASQVPPPGNLPGNVPIDARCVAGAGASSAGISAKDAVTTICPSADAEGCWVAAAAMMIRRGFMTASIDDTQASSRRRHAAPRMAG